MKKLFLYKIFLILLLCFSSAYSEVYKTIDEDGNIIFTDKKPSVSTEEIEIKEVQIIENNTSSVLPEIENGGNNTKIDIDVSLLNHYKQMRPSLDKSDWHIHDPSRVINSSLGQIISVTGKAQEDGYKCGLETWYRTNPNNDARNIPVNEVSVAVQSILNKDTA